MAEHPARPGGDPPYTVANAIFLCGVNDATLFNGLTKAERIAADLFDDDYNACMDKTINELKEDLKAYSSLTQANGQIRLGPGEVRNIKAFIQWTKDKVRTGNNPEMELFDINDAPSYILRARQIIRHLCRIRQR